MAICIIIPCFNEVDSIIPLLEKIEQVLNESNKQATIVVVNDGSTDNSLNQLHAFDFQTTNVRLVVLDLPTNLGHQQAIRQGLIFAQKTDNEQFVVMDGDGEDSPETLPELLTDQEHQIVQVVRGRRKENWKFRIGYAVYQLLFRIFTGKKMNVGNFCMLRRKALEATLAHAYVHFAAFVQQLPFPKSFIVSDRASRLAGKSKMNAQKLMYHAFMSLVEYAQSLLMLFFRLFLFLILLFLGMLGYVLYHKLFTGKAILGWASTLSIGLLNLALLAFGFFMLGMLILRISKRQPKPDNQVLYKQVR